MKSFISHSLMAFCAIVAVVLAGCQTSPNIRVLSEELVEPGGLGVITWEPTSTTFLVARDNNGLQSCEFLSNGRLRVTDPGKVADHYACSELRKGFTFTNLALGKCQEATCEAIYCRLGLGCKGGQSQTDLDNEAGALCSAVTSVQDCKCHKISGGGLNGTFCKCNELE